uniref:Acyl carrier protein n=1 Tax=Streptomyces sp. NBC_00049 TaxID=2903617 RepID=A0AAU2K135_9ACTN
MSGGGQPGLDEIEACFAAVVEGRVSRDAADRWAGLWVVDDTLEWDELSWWALGRLYGIDLRMGPEEPYLHDDEQVRGWLEELRRRRAG